MSNKLGRFELVSQISQSPVATVFKALDPDSQKTVALKVVDLGKAADRAALVTRVFEEADQSKPLNSHNIAVLYGVGDEGDQLLAATEYVQGNSVATTLARKDGFSIWDLQDIARQLCHVLDHAQVHRVVHQSLEPAKIMVQWEGLVKVLGFGISSMTASVTPPESVPEAFHYYSPEQLRGEPCDHRSALFSLGAILYEMATEQKAFGGETVDQVRHAILESTPPAPLRLKADLNPGLSDLIMKAISKSPSGRYQSGQDLLRDLEQCKTANKAATFAALFEPKTRAAAVGTSAISSGQPAMPPTPRPSVTASTVTLPGDAKSSLAVDPMTIKKPAKSPDSGPAASSFSEIDQMPPLKESYVPASPAPVAEEPPEPDPLPQARLNKSAPDKTKIRVSKAAQKAVTEIRHTPPKLYLSALVVAGVLIAAAITGLMVHNYLADREQTGTTSAPAASAEMQTDPATAKAPPITSVAPPSAASAQPAQTQAEQTEGRAAAIAAARASKKLKLGNAKPALPVPAVAVAQLSIISNPAGVQIAFDGGAVCETPCALTGIAPGQHVIAATKPGYGPESRTIAMSAGESSSLSLTLNQLAAKLSITSSPAGAMILVDGKDTGKITPAVFSLEKPGAHTVVVRREGYLEETSSASADAGQTATLNLNLKSLGSTDKIRGAGGKFKKIFGGGDTSGMGIVSVKTQPKGAQIMVNNQVLDKTAPFDFYLNPGTYLIDISMSGRRNVHRVITVKQSEKLAIDETLSPE